MRLTGRVVNGKIELEDEMPLPEGAPVEVTISEIGPYELTEEEDEELWQAHLSIERGEGIPAEVLLQKLRGKRDSD